MLTGKGAYFFFVYIAYGFHCTVKELLVQPRRLDKRSRHQPAKMHSHTSGTCHPAYSCAPSPVPLSVPVLHTGVHFMVYFLDQRFDVFIGGFSADHKDSWCPDKKLLLLRFHRYILCLHGCLTSAGCRNNRRTV
mgnify:CR=1 FL=1